MLVTVPGAETRKVQAAASVSARVSKTRQMQAVSVIVRGSETRQITVWISDTRQMQAAVSVTVRGSEAQEGAHIWAGTVESQVARVIRPPVPNWRQRRLGLMTS